MDKMCVFCNEPVVYDYIDVKVGTYARGSDSFYQKPNGMHCPKCGLKYVETEGDNND